MSRLCRSCRDGDHRRHQREFGGICVGCACGHLPPRSFFMQSAITKAEADSAPRGLLEKFAADIEGTPAASVVLGDPLFQMSQDEVIAEVHRLRAELARSVTREQALDAVFRMSNWQHGYGQGRLATTDDCVRCLDWKASP